MATTPPYGSDAEPSIFHDQIGCPRGNAIPKDQRVYDVAGRTRCGTCLQLMQAQTGQR